MSPVITVFIALRVYLPIILSIHVKVWVGGVPDVEHLDAVNQLLVGFDSHVAVPDSLTMVQVAGREDYIVVQRLH